MGLSAHLFPVVIEQDESGFFASCPALQGCHAQGTSYEDALANLKDAVQLHVEDRKARGEEIPSPGVFSLTTLEVSA